MAWGSTPVERQRNIICFNGKCKACDKTTYICTSGKMCRDHKDRRDAK